MGGENRNQKEKVKRIGLTGRAEPALNDRMMLANRGITSSKRKRVVIHAGSNARVAEKHASRTTRWRVELVLWKRQLHWTGKKRVIPRK